VVELINSGIYCIKCIVNNKRYIGATTHFRKRKAKHLNNLKNGNANDLIQFDYNLYGDDKFVFEILEYIDKKNVDKLKDREEYWSNFYKTYVKKYGYGFGYNIKNVDKITLENNKGSKNGMYGKPSPRRNLEDWQCFKIKEMLLENIFENWKEKYARISEIIDTHPRQIRKIKDGNHWSSNMLKGGYNDWIKEDNNVL
jgi:hypothetical protein